MARIETLDPIHACGRVFRKIEDVDCGAHNLRFGSKAHMAICAWYVRFPPIADIRDGAALGGKMSRNHLSETGLNLG